MWWGLALSLMAGLSTGLGGASVFLVPGGSGARGAPRLVAFLLGFAGGAMVTVAVMDLLWTLWLTTGSVCSVVVAAGSGIGLWRLLSLLTEWGSRALRVSSRSSDVERGASSDEDDAEHKARLAMGSMGHLGWMAFVSLTLHNLPEGVSVGLSSLRSDGDSGLHLAIAIAAHNLPEGLLIALPLHLAGQSRGRAVLLSLLSGLSEPVGAFLSIALVGKWLSHLALSWILASVGGLMITISVVELLPEAAGQGQPTYFVFGVLFGIIMLHQVGQWL